jgi:shikimate dehydrogenase
VTKAYALIGDPVDHSLSPAIYNALFRHFGLDAEFILLRVEKGLLSGLESLVEENALMGYSVTMPHKEDVIEHLDSLTPRAADTRSVNHVFLTNGKWTGDTTDGAGVVNSIKAVSDAAGRKALVLGYGGAARSAAYSLCGEVKSVTVCGRDIYKAKALAAMLRQHVGPDVTAEPISRLSEITPECDLFVNATPLGMTGYDSFESLEWLNHMPRGSVICDMVYKPAETELLRAAVKAGHIIVSGTDVLIYQAYEQFFSWTGKRADEDADREVRKAVERELGATRQPLPAPLSSYC